MKYRCHWTPPLAFDPFEQETVYYGCQVIFKTTTRGRRGQVISPDLSTQDPTRIVSSGGIVGDNLGQFYGEVVFAIAPSKIQKGLIWAGTNDGLIWNTRDGGSDVDQRDEERHGPAGVGHDPEDRAVALRRGHGLRRGRLPPDGQPRPVHLQDDRLRPDVDEDQRRAAEGPPARLRAVGGREPEPQGDAVRRHGPRVLLLDRRRRARGRSSRTACRRRRSRGSRCSRSTTTSSCRPTAAGSTCCATSRASSSRTRWTRTRPAFLYAPRPGFREARSGSAEFLYSLKAATEPVKLEIVGRGRRASSGRSTARARRAEPRRRGTCATTAAAQVELRTIPPDNPHIWEEARFKGKDTRPIVHWGIQQPAAPGAARHAGPLHRAPDGRRADARRGRSTC